MTNNKYFWTQILLENPPFKSSSIKRRGSHNTTHIFSLFLFFFHSHTLYTKTKRKHKKNNNTKLNMEGSPLSSYQNKDQEFNLREWHLRARVSRENPSSRRFSASYIRSFREDPATSFNKSSNNFTISSTASSPGYNLKGTHVTRFKY